MKIVAEIGSAHEGDIGQAKKLIEAAAEAGAHVLKTQIIFADEILHPKAPSIALASGEGTQQKINLYQRFQRLQRPLSFYEEIAQHSRRCGLEFWASPFGTQSALLLRNLSPSAIKIASPESNYDPLLREVRSYGIPLVVSIGVSTLQDIAATVELLSGTLSLTLLHCVTAYPACPKSYNLRLIKNLHHLLGVPVGVSDHTPHPTLLPLLALSQGCPLLEKHFCLTRRGGLDDAVALTEREFLQMVQKIREASSLPQESLLKDLEKRFGEHQIEKILGDGVKRLSPHEKKIYRTTNRSLCALTPLEKGASLTKNNTAFLRVLPPFQPGLPPSCWPEIEGAVVVHPIPAGEGITMESLLCKKTKSFSRLSHQQVIAAASSLTFSISGWRGIFAADREIHSTTTEVPPPHLGVIALAALAFSRFLGPQDERFLIVATDSRPSSPPLAEAALQVLLSLGWQIHYLGISPIPEALAYTRSLEGTAGLFYLSASHNPLGYNGIKFAAGDGAVLSPSQHTRLLQLFHDTLDAPHSLEMALDALTTPPLEKATLLSSATFKKEARRLYRLFLERDVLKFNAPLQKLPVLGVLGELNGSARGSSIDQEALTRWGGVCHLLNATPGHFVHEVLPEGRSLLLCQEQLEKLHQHDPRFQLGYVPDCDGDRGNFIVRDQKLKTTRPLSAQETLAVGLLSRLALLAYQGALGVREAVVVNGPTSLLAEAIGEIWGVRVFRAEVGEANLNAALEHHQKAGWCVRLIGEGSNGGAIFPPGKVRDPLANLGTLLSFLRRSLDKQGEKTPFSLWQERAGLTPTAPSISALLSSLPPFLTSTTEAPLASVPLARRFSFSLFSERYLSLFEKSWKKQTSLRKQLGLDSWEVLHTSGESAVLNPSFPLASGGLSIRFKDKGENLQGFLWTRASGTEPRLRLLVDLKGFNQDGLTSLLAWHHDLARSSLQPLTQLSKGTLLT